MITVFADLNCPFCYALNEWVFEQGLSSEVDWRLIDHNPLASYNTYTNKELIELTEEVFTLRQRAPDIPIVLPAGRPNVVKAEVVLNAVKDQYPDSYDELCRRVYHAVWLDDKNIENDQVLMTMLEDLGISDLELTNAAEESIQRTTAQWDSGPFERRLPVIQHSSDEFILGLAPKEKTLQYMHSQAEKPGDYSLNFCASAVKPLIAVMGDWSNFWQAGKKLRASNDILFYQQEKKLAEEILEFSGPDIVFVATRQLPENFLKQYADVLSRCIKYSCPLVVLSNEITEAQEIELYRNGCSEVISLDENAELIALKVQRLIEIRQTLSQLLRTSLTDSLTQLANHRSFKNFLEQEWSRSSRSKQPFSLLMIDIDDFKLYNDTYGHLAGDGCLREVAEVLKGQLFRTNDMAFRVGGEEMAIILPGVEQQGAIEVAQRLVEAVYGRAIVHEKSAYDYVSVSIGIVTHCPTQKTSTKP